MDDPRHHRGPHVRNTCEKWAPDLCRDPVHVWFDKYHFVFPIALAVSLYLIGGMPWLVWGFFVRSIFVLHSTWLVNSATHVWGYRSHETRDNSTNLWWVAMVTYGEGWHNNHHAYQTSARHGLRWWEIDMTYMAVRLMALCGLAYAVKLPKFRSDPTDTPAPSMKPVKGAYAPESRSDDESELAWSVSECNAEGPRPRLKRSHR